jgi:hypothetical protein
MLLPRAARENRQQRRRRTTPRTSQATSLLLQLAYCSEIFLKYAGLREGAAMATGRVKTREILPAKKIAPYRFATPCHAA